MPAARAARPPGPLSNSAACSGSRRGGGCGCARPAGALPLLLGCSRCSLLAAVGRRAARRRRAADASAQAAESELHGVLRSTLALGARPRSLSGGLARCASGRLHRPNAFCFTDCATDAGRDAGPDVRFADGFNQDTGQACDSADGCDAGADVAPDVCVPAVDGREVCNGLDDDCDGLTDEPIGSPGPRPGGIDFTHVKICGTCANDCVVQAANVEGLACTGVPDAGRPVRRPASATTEGASTTSTTSTDRANGCEYYCPWNPTGMNTTDPGDDNCGRDDDCDGANGRGRRRLRRHRRLRQMRRQVRHSNGTPVCVSTRASPASRAPRAQAATRTAESRPASRATTTSTRYAANGCEYHCDPTGRGNLRRLRQRLRRQDRLRRSRSRGAGHAGRSGMLRRPAR